MHRWGNYAECVLLRLWLWYNGKQRISIQARWRSVIFVPLIILVVRPMEHSLLVFSVTSQRGLVIIRFAWTRDFLKLVMQLVFLLGLYLRGAPVDCIILFVIIWFDWVMFILLFGRQVNGECADYRGHSLAVKNACQQTRTRGGWCWSVLFLYTIFELNLLGLMRLQRYLTPNTKNWLIFMDMIGSKDIIYNLVIMRPTTKPS